MDIPYRDSQSIAGFMQTKKHKETLRFSESRDSAQHKTSSWKTIKKTQPGVHRIVIGIFLQDALFWNHEIGMPCCIGTTAQHLGSSPKEDRVSRVDGESPRFHRLWLLKHPHPAFKQYKTHIHESYEHILHSYLWKWICNNMNIQ